ncbi:MAG: helix-turn-helix domain-containing protein [Serratia sp. (in: enterobacteria)]|uniref:helix-turn-helix domain-containing protein n=1 Tax=Serratia sp. (in: enterobacteria) TaxID=616 RepID=UPI003F40B626
MNSHCYRKEGIQLIISEQTAEYQIRKLQEALLPFGIEVRSMNDNSTGKPGLCNLEIRWDAKELHYRRTRNAGRPFEASSVSWETIEQWRMEGMAAKAIAKKLNVSRATYYNRLKLRKETPEYDYF